MNWQLKEQQSGLAIFAQGQNKLRLEAYAPNIMRVTQTTQDAFALRNEPMITAPAPPAVMALRADAECAALDCGELTAQLNLVTGALSWLAYGQPLMREPDENGRGRREIDIILNRFDPDAPMTCLLYSSCRCAWLCDILSYFAADVTIIDVYKRQYPMRACASALCSFGSAIYWVQDAHVFVK